LIRNNSQPDPAYAATLMDSLIALVIAHVNKPTINYRGDPARYREVREAFEREITALGLRSPFPWPTVDEAAAYLKMKASGTGSYAAQMSVVENLAQPLRSQLEALVRNNAGAEKAAPGNGEDLAGLVLQFNEQRWVIGAPLRSGGFGRVFEATSGTAQAVAKSLSSGRRAGVALQARWGTRQSSPHPPRAQLRHRHAQTFSGRSS
jgi:hypothetical protein